MQIPLVYFLFLVFATLTTAAPIGYGYRGEAVSIDQLSGSRSLESRNLVTYVDETIEKRGLNQMCDQLCRDAKKGINTKIQAITAFTNKPPPKPQPDLIEPSRSRHLSLAENTESPVIDLEKRKISIKKEVNVLLWLVRKHKPAPKKPLPPPPSVPSPQGTASQRSVRIRENTLKIGCDRPNLEIQTPEPLFSPSLCRDFIDNVIVGSARVPLWNGFAGYIRCGTKFDDRHPAQHASDEISIEVLLPCIPDPSSSLIVGEPAMFMNGSALRLTSEVLGYGFIEPVMKNLITGVLLCVLGANAWGQCGGIGWTGATTCIPGWTCVYSHPSLCVVGRPSLTTSTSAGPINTTFPRATYTEIINFGSNPTGVRAWLYVPQNLLAKPPIVVGIHWCSGNADAFYSGSNYKALADQKGFIVIYPQAPNSDGCWDVHTLVTLTHNGGGDSLGIVSAVRWTITNFNADTTKIFATGISSGAMMTNVLIGAYPDSRASKGQVPGIRCALLVPTSRRLKNGEIAFGQPILVTRARTRPKIQFWHGTLDTTLNYNNFGEEVKQWTNVFGVSTTPTNTVLNYPLSGWTRYDYGPNVMGISAAGVDHTSRIRQIRLWNGLGCKSGIHGL
ncbi:carbohydrate esterase family 1 protein [Serendipita vermifera MAFF 305830]|uniref:Carbohydrate esterase family 1 protein n=1 Tax=Serendipita vermifera MAFF 305830 TaxID=933852 RepID=A0A0C3APX0_SERVB|nr:carbohydrate esterase family 1 protein [Serendipita vermifera MAFF 305830]